VRSELRAFEMTDAAEWNRFVESAPYHSFPQLWEWGEVRAAAGWRPVRLAVGPAADRPVAGAQLLLRRVPLTGWHLAYVPRGPIGALDDAATRVALHSALRALGRSEKIATVRADPEARVVTPYGQALLGPHGGRRRKCSRRRPGSSTSRWGRTRSAPVSSGSTAST